jgi:putative Mn2+ efflux pump MntP
MRSRFDHVIRLVLVAVALGLSNFAASIGIGLAGVDAGVRLRVGLAFGLFEVTMPVIGLLLGHHLAHAIGSASAYVGGGLLVATGAYGVIQARRGGPEPVPIGGSSLALIVTAAVLSIDNLVAGFALGTQKVSVPLSAVVIAGVSVGMSLVGLELGHRLGAAVEKYSQEIWGIVLILVGSAIAGGLF